MKMKIISAIIVGTISEISLVGCGKDHEVYTVPEQTIISEEPEFEDEYFDDDYENIDFEDEYPEYKDVLTDEDYLEDNGSENEKIENAGEIETAETAETEAIKDGEYVTGAEYKGKVADDGKSMTVTTALYKFVNSPAPEYEEKSYTFKIADDCLVYVIQEDATDYPFMEKKDLVNDFLEGVSGLPITLKFKNNEIIQIEFSS